MIVKTSSLFVMFLLIGSSASAAGDAARSASEMTRWSAKAHAAQMNTNEVRVTFVGNAGFLITVNDKKILIDALFSGFPGDYILPREIQDKLALGLPPFDNIDLVLATHSHGDHFDASLVRRFLSNNPAAVFASTPQATALLNDFSNRVIAFAPAKNKTAPAEIQGVHVEAVYLSHGAPPEGKTEILNLLIWRPSMALPCFIPGISISRSSVTMNSAPCTCLRKKSIWRSCSIFISAMPPPSISSFRRDRCQACFPHALSLHRSAHESGIGFKKLSRCHLIQGGTGKLGHAAGGKNKMIDMILPPIMSLRWIRFQVG